MLSLESGIQDMRDIQEFKEGQRILYFITH